MTRRYIFLLTVLVSATLSAAEGPQHKADWLEQAVEEVVNDCAGHLGATVTWSAAASERKAWVMSLVTADAQPLDDLLPVVADLAGLLIHQEGDQLLVTDVNEAKELVTSIYDIRGLTRVDFDYPGPTLDDPLASGHEGAVFELFGGHSEPEGVDADSVIELIETTIDPDSWDQDGVSLAYRHSLGLVIRQTEAVHRQIALALAGLRSRLQRTVTYHLTAGVSAAAPALTGVVDRITGDAQVAALRESRSLTFSGRDGQRVACTDLQQHSFVADVDVASSGTLDPHIAVLNTGLVADVQTELGIKHVCVVRLSWAELLEQRLAEIRRGPQVLAGSIELDGDIEIETESTADFDIEADTGKGTASGTSDGEGQLAASGTITGATRIQGERQHIDLPRVWQWQPRAELQLVDDQDLLLSAQRPDGHHAVIHLRLLTASYVASAATPVALQKTASQHGCDLHIAARPAAQAMPVGGHEPKTWSALVDFYGTHNWQLLNDRSRIRLQPGPSTKTFLKYYDMRHILQPLTDFPGPLLEIPHPGANRLVMPEIMPDDEPEVDEFLDLIIETIDLDGGDEGIEEWYGNMFVTTSSAKHAQISALLAQIADKGLHVLQVHELKPTAPVGVLSARQWRTVRPEAMLRGQAMINVGQRNHFHAGPRTRYVADGDRIDATMDPIISVVGGGLVVDATMFTGGPVADISLRLMATDDAKLPTRSVADGGQLAMSIELLQQAIQTADGQWRLPLAGAVVVGLGQRRIAVSFKPVP